MDTELQKLVTFSEEDMAIGKEFRNELSALRMLSLIESYAIGHRLDVRSVLDTICKLWECTSLGMFERRILQFIDDVSLTERLIRLQLLLAELDKSLFDEVFYRHLEGCFYKLISQVRSKDEIHSKFCIHTDIRKMIVYRIGIIAESEKKVIACNFPLNRGLDLINLNTYDLSGEVYRCADESEYEKEFTKVLSLFSDKKERYEFILYHYCKSKMKEDYLLYVRSMVSEGVMKKDVLEHLESLDQLTPFIGSLYQDLQASAPLGVRSPTSVKRKLPNVFKFELLKNIKKAKLQELGDLLYKEEFIESSGEVFALVLLENWNVNQNKIKFTCETIQAVYILDELKRLFKNLTPKNIGASRKFQSKNKKNITANNFSASKSNLRYTKIKDEKKIDLILKVLD